MPGLKPRSFEFYLRRVAVLQSPEVVHLVSGGSLRLRNWYAARLSFARRRVLKYLQSGTAWRSATGAAHTGGASHGT